MSQPPSYEESLSEEEPVPQMDQLRLNNDYSRLRRVMRLGLRALTVRDLLAVEGMNLSDQQVVLLDQLVQIYDRVQRGQRERIRESLLASGLIHRIDARHIRPRPYWYFTSEPSPPATPEGGRSPQPESEDEESPEGNEGNRNQGQAEP